MFLGNLSPSEDNMALCGELNIFVWRKYFVVLVGRIEYLSVTVSPNLSCLLQFLFLFKLFKFLSNSETSWTVAHRAPLSMGFPRQVYGIELPFPPPEDFSDSGIESMSPTLQVDTSPKSQQRNPLSATVLITCKINNTPTVWHTDLLSYDSC